MSLASMPLSLRPAMSLAMASELRVKRLACGCGLGDDAGRDARDVGLGRNLARGGDGYGPLDALLLSLRRRPRSNRES